MAKTVHKAEPKEPDLVVHEVEQGSAEWWDARMGKATASAFATIMADGERRGRSKLLRQLAAERMIGEPTETFQSREMEMGKAIEPEIRAFYGRTRFAEVRQVGFVYNPAVDAGWSPDGLVGDDGAVELKWHRPDVMVELLEKDGFALAHRAQCLGALWVGRRSWLDLVVYSHPKLPKKVIRFERAPGYEQVIARAVRMFNYDLRQLVDKLRRMNGEVVPIRQDRDEEIPA